MFPFLRMSDAFHYSLFVIHYSLNNIDFRVYIDTETLADIFADGLAEVDNLLTCSSATIDEYQSLLVVYASTP